MVCLFCFEIECYGYYFVVGESVWEYLFLWGFKCIGFDLVCVGGCYFDEWYCVYLLNLCELVFELNMFVFLWLVKNILDGKYM